MHTKIRRNLSNLLLIGSLVFGVGCQMIQAQEYQFKFQDRNATEEEVVQQLNELYLGKDANEFMTMLENTKGIDNDTKGICGWIEPIYKENPDPDFAVNYDIACGYRIGRRSLLPPFGVHWGFEIKVDSNKKITNFKVIKTLMG
jgi:hypothetical protein